MSAHTPIPGFERSVPKSPNVETSKSARLDVLDAESRRTIELILALAPRGLSSMLLPNGTSFAQTARLVDSAAVPRLEGENPRYTAMAALGLATLEIEQQHAVLRGSTADELIRALIVRVAQSEDLGAVALAAWAAAEVLGGTNEALFDRLSRAIAEGPMDTVVLSWAITAATAAVSLEDRCRLIADWCRLLRDAQGRGGLFPHTVPAGAQSRLRAHVGSFADQVYPIQALARASRVIDGDELDAANACADRICELQGDAGQWWWHYDARGTSVVEKYPVYSVHQHAMAPMVLFDLVEAGGRNHTEPIARGIGWIFAHPETGDELVSNDHNVVWRKIGRREPRKLARSMSAVTTAIHPAMRLPGLDHLLPPTRIDHECRPYELGWCLYAWTSPPIADRDRQDGSTR